MRDDRRSPAVASLTQAATIACALLNGNASRRTMTSASSVTVMKLASARSRNKSRLNSAACKVSPRQGHRTIGIPNGAEYQRLQVVLDVVDVAERRVVYGRQDPQ